MCKGRYIPVGADETGKNGAIPDPMYAALAMAYTLLPRCANLDHGTVSTSPCQMFARPDRRTEEGVKLAK